MIDNIENTNREALRAKKSSFDKGYFKDNFIEMFYHNKEKRDIIINRGYWLR